MNGKQPDSRNSNPLAFTFSDEQLLGRPAAVFALSRILQAVEGQTVLVTGAAGSIGSELCRQLARCNPKLILGLDIAESPLFEIQQELVAAPATRFVPIIANVQNELRMREICKTYSPSLCFHAAAYKHVPLMEDNIFEAVENNILATCTLARAAAEYGALQFVLISSDKAVRPTSVMGVTKRIAEMFLQHMSHGPTRFTAVRFGNVLGSTGSVLTVFRRQLAAGGPLTVTHPEMRRFFMTTAEACHLVLQASTLHDNATIYVLDMGEQVAIVDLAYKLIRLSGLEPGRDIRVEFSGVRPGEKLSEELSHLFEDTVPTEDPHIRAVISSRHGEMDVAGAIDSLLACCRRRDLTGLVQTMQAIVPDYEPSESVRRRLDPLPATSQED